MRGRMAASLHPLCSSNGRNSTSGRSLALPFGELQRTPGASWRPRQAKRPLSSPTSTPAQACGASESRWRSLKDDRDGLRHSKANMLMLIWERQTQNHRSTVFDSNALRTTGNQPQALRLEHTEPEIAQSYKYPPHVQRWAQSGQPPPVPSRSRISASLHSDNRPPADR